ncbi:hypothetical protein [Butyricimonas paravirosa]|uniref:hypothetical protein n=1 Tax=Butyricimonas paravirosa TaxID=1472417 RepID=UPI0024312482|nr:hypothetical protein [Butyricimonas paravirosa]
MGKSWLIEANVLIRAHLHLNPDELSDEEWSENVYTAIWIENRYFEKLSKILGG